MYMYVCICAHNLRNYHARKKRYGTQGISAGMAVEQWSMTTIQSCELQTLSKYLNRIKTQMRMPFLSFFFFGRFAHIYK